MRKNNRNLVNAKFATLSVFVLMMLAGCCDKDNCRRCHTTNNYYFGDRTEVNGDNNVIIHEDTDISNSGAGSVYYNDNTNVNVGEGNWAQVSPKPQPKPQPQPQPKPQPQPQPIVIHDTIRINVPVPEPVPCQTETEETYTRITIKGSPRDVAAVLRQMGYAH